MTSVAPGLDASHDPDSLSWVESANDPDSDFPIQNLPFGRFREEGDPDWKIGVAIGDQVLDLRRAGLISHADINRLIRVRPEFRRDLRLMLHSGLLQGSVQADRWRAALVPMQRVQLGVPCEVGDYTDFYVGIHHATKVGALFRPDNPLLPNYKWVPIGYHGRASTILPSGQDVCRPHGQMLVGASDQPELLPSRRLDFELEMGIIIGRPNALGHAISIDEAEDHIFGLTLFNDWSARDIQAWEYQPLGPFLSKSFASTISPWMVTMDALEPFRCPLTRTSSDPQSLAYLDSEENRRRGSLDVELEVWLQTASMREAGLSGDCISRSNFAEAAYWTAAQLVAHHTVNGCALSNGDLFGTGTLSGAASDQGGSMLELSDGGRHPLVLSNGERRTFLEDGDCVTLKGCCVRPGHRRIGFGQSSATVLAARR